MPPKYTFSYCIPLQIPKIGLLSDRAFFTKLNSTVSLSIEVPKHMLSSEDFILWDYREGEISPPPVSISPSKTNSSTLSF